MKHKKKFISVVLAAMLVTILSPVSSAYAADKYSEASAVLLYNIYEEYGGYGAHSVDLTVADGSYAVIDDYSIWMGEGDFINYVPSESYYNSGTDAYAHSVFQAIVGDRLVKGVAYTSCSCYSEIENGRYYISR